MDFTEIFYNTDWAYGFLIFAARVVDVSLGTLRTIAIVHGRTLMSFWLGFFEAAIWLVVVSGIVQVVTQQPALGLVYAFGFATGNLVGIKVEKFIAMGHMILRVNSNNDAAGIAKAMRNQGYNVTSFTGEGQKGPVTEHYVVCRRRELKELLATVTALDPYAFYVTEQAGSVSSITRPIMQPVTGWRAVIKKK
ncbi:MULTISPECIES: DUF2179 domain-containing protein [Desulfosediminicola]|uniref:DUF2179 domain-containing protein n=1 Tax=Desulfosediminicola TaxID=2886823 RepID=UPI0010AC8B8D|nr:DUF5698 domain-containing protein [Desulfosediminicola ganghwensis]